MWVNDGRPCLTSVPLSLPRIWVIASTLTAPHLPLGRSPLERVGKGRGVPLLSLLSTLSLSLSFIVYSFTYSSSSLSLSLSISNFSATTCSSLTFNRLSVISGWYFFNSSIYLHDIYNSDGEHDTRHLAFPMHRQLSPRTDQTARIISPNSRSTIEPRIRSDRDTDVSLSYT